MFVQVKNCTVGIVDDDVYEDDEIFQLKLTRPLGTEKLGANIGDIDSTKITVTNMDDGKCVTYEFNFCFNIMLYMCGKLYYTKQIYFHYV